MPRFLQAQEDCLRFILPSSLTKDGEDHYVDIPAKGSMSYSETVNGAIKHLSQYRHGMTQDNIVVRRREFNRTDDWIWVDMSPEHWLDLVHPGDEMGIFPRNEFTNGLVFYAYGSEVYGRTTWSELVIKEKMPTIDRPLSYKDATRRLNLNIANLINLDHETGKTMPSELVRLSNKFYFVTFEDTATARYRYFPEEAYTNDEVWREWVPRPGSILGFILK